MKNNKKDLRTAIFIDETGGIKTRIFKILKIENDIVHADFGNNEIYLINKKCIRANRVVIYKTIDGKIIIQNPDAWKDIDLKSYNIKELRFNLQNYSLQESKAALSRWTIPETLINKLAPLFKLLLICIAVGVIGWALFKFSGIVLNNIVASRIQDCNSVLPTITAPTNVVLTPEALNLTNPI